MGLATVRVELCKAAPVEVLKIRVGPGERQVDVAEYSRFPRTRLARCARHQPLGERRNGGGVLLVKECPGVRMRVGGYFLALSPVLAGRVGQNSGPSNGPRPNGGTDQKRAASRIVLAHSCLLSSQITVSITLPEASRWIKRAQSLYDRSMLRILLM